MGYYDVAEILAEEERIPVSLRVALPSVGVALDPTASESDFQRGSKLDLPMWLLKTFLSRNFVTILESKKFSNRLRREAQADAACVNLRAVCPYFYTCAAAILALAPDRALWEFVMRTFVDRYSAILVKSLSSSEQELATAKPRLSKEELALLEAGQNSLARLSQWQQRLHSTIRASSVLGRNTSKRGAPWEAPGGAPPNSARGRWS